MKNALITLGVSDAAQYLYGATRESRQRLRELASFGIDPEVSNELATVWEDCRKPGWDGFNAQPVTQEVLRNAYTFLESLSQDPVPNASFPSIGAEPDGDLTFEWHKSARHTLSVSITADGDLHYAALFGPNREYGTEAFFDEVPDNIRRLISRVYSA